MGKHFIDVDRQSPMLFPPSVEDWLPEDHLARFVVDTVDQLDLRNIYAEYTGNGGSRAYSPRVMLSLIIYCYATGIHSSRQIERSTYDSIACRFIACGTHPDHDSINTFRSRFRAHVQDIFVQILLIARQMGVLKLGTLSLDGTRLKANASKHKAMSYGYACRLEKQLRQEVEDLIRAAESADQHDIPDGLSLGEEISRRQKRLEAIAEAKHEIERRSRARYEEQKREYDHKMAKRKAHQEHSGRKPRGKPPREPGPEPEDKDQRNFTDPESRIMPQSGGGFVQAYNAQAGVDTGTHMILISHATQRTNDKLEIDNAVENIQELPSELGSINALIADAGYYSEHNVRTCQSNRITPYISMNREKHNQSLERRNRMAPHEPENPEDANSAIDWMHYRLQTPQGKSIYAKRKGTSETVFGIIKQVMKYRQFMLRGFEKIKDEWNFVCMTWNIRRLHSLTRGFGC